MNATPFEIEFPEPALDDLRTRLRKSRWPEVIGDDSWSYGVPQKWLRDMADYWANQWDAQAQVSEMNRYEHFCCELDGIPIHFIHAKGVGPNPRPLILTHGWPWCFWDFKDLIDPLSDPAGHGGSNKDAFDVIVPSLPGFGFSIPLRTAGIGVPRIAELWVKLMTEVLGYDRFGAHGGDWGSIIGAQLGHAHADRLIGTHMSLPIIPGLGPGVVKPEDFGDDEQWMLPRMIEAGALIQSHVSVHSRDPQTLSYAMADSPLGMAAWLWERRRNWSDCNGDIESVFDRDHLCNLAAIYWLNGSFTSSLRLYFEQFGGEAQLAHNRQPVIEAPTGFAIGPKELILLPRKIAAEHSNLKRWKILSSGGHFAAPERPAEMVEELRAFFRDLS